MEVKTSLVNRYIFGFNDKRKVFARLFIFSQRFYIEMMSFPFTFKHGHQIPMDFIVTTGSPYLFSPTHTSVLFKIYMGFLDIPH